MRHFIQDTNEHFKACTMCFYLNLNTALLQPTTIKTKHITCMRLLHPTLMNKGHYLHKKIKFIAWHSFIPTIMCISRRNSSVVCEIITPDRSRNLVTLVDFKIYFCYFASKVFKTKKELQSLFGKVPLWPHILFQTHKPLLGWLFSFLSNHRHPG